MSTDVVQQLMWHGLDIVIESSQKRFQRISGNRDLR